MAEHHELAANAAQTCDVSAINTSLERSKCCYHFFKCQNGRIALTLGPILRACIGLHFVAVFQTQDQAAAQSHYRHITRNIFYGLLHNNKARCPSHLSRPSPLLRPCTDKACLHKNQDHNLSDTKHLRSPQIQRQTPHPQ